MKDIKKQYQHQILETLLNKYESSLTFKTGVESKQRPQFAIENSSLSDAYFDEMDHTKREAIHEALNELAMEGIIEVTWPKFQKDRLVDKVYLNFSAVSKIYQFLNLVPKEEQLSILRKVLSPLEKHPWIWVKKWWADVDQALQQRKNTGLDLGDIKGYEYLVQVFFALVTMEDSQLKRIFSQKILGDSKAFEQRIERRLLSIMKKYNDDEFETDEEYLDSIGIVQNSKQILIAGDMNFKIRDNIYHLKDLSGGIGLSTQTIKQMYIDGILARFILLIENLTTFSEVLQSQETEGGLFIYTGGFPHRGIQRFLYILSGYLSNATTKRICFWGDIDYGGIHIFEYLKNNFFPSLTPYAMDTQTYEKYLGVGITFSETYGKKLENYINHSKNDVSRWRSLISMMLIHKKWIEQESMRIEKLYL